MKARTTTKQGFGLVTLSVLVMAFSFLKEAVFARYFGTTEAADAYTVAIQAPEILFAVVWESINAIVIPLYTEKRQREGQAGANRFISNFLTFFLIGAILFLLIGELLAKQITYVFAPGLNLETRTLATALLRTLLPILVFEGVCRISEGVLHTHGQFLATKLISALRNIGVIVALLLFAGKFGVFSAAYGFVCGIFAEFVLCAVVTARYAKFCLFLDRQDAALRKAACMSVPILLGIGITEINQLADKVVSSYLGSGGIASLNYATKLSSMVGSVVFGSIVTLVYPRFAHYITDNDEKSLGRSYLQTLRVLILLCIPITVGGALCSQSLVSLAFQRGQFDTSDVAIVSLLFLFYLVSISFTYIRMVAAKLFTAFCDTKTPMVNALMGAVTNIVLNIILAKAFGLVGLAIATAISACIACFLLLSKLRGRFSALRYSDLLPTVWKAVLSAIGMAAVLLVIKSAFGSLHAFISLFLSVGIGVLVYGLLLVALRVPEVRPVCEAALQFVKKKLHIHTGE